MSDAPNGERGGGGGGGGRVKKADVTPSGDTSAVKNGGERQPRPRGPRRNGGGGGGRRGDNSAQANSNNNGATSKNVIVGAAAAAPGAAKEPQAAATTPFVREPKKQPSSSRRKPRRKSSAVDDKLPVAPSNDHNDSITPPAAPVDIVPTTAVATTTATRKPAREAKLKRAPKPREPRIVAGVATTNASPTHQDQPAPVADASKPHSVLPVALAAPAEPAAPPAEPAASPARIDKPAPHPKTTDAAATAVPSLEPLVPLETPTCFEDAAWFRASDGDLRFAQWLFGRSQGAADVRALQDAAMLVRVYQLYMLEKRVQLELQNRPATAPDADVADEDAGAIPSDAADCWMPEAIVNDAMRVLRVSKLALVQQTALTTNSASQLPKRSLERTLVKELVENTTELLLCRATSSAIPTLERWLAFVSLSGQDLLLQQEQEEQQEPTNDDAAAADIIDSSSVQSPAVATPSKRSQKRQERLRSTNKDYAIAACEQIHAGIAFLRESDAVADNTTDKLPVLPAALDATLVAAIGQLFHAQRISDTDEARRLQVASDLEIVFRRRYPQCTVQLFGSSLSLFGARTSDLDMCLLFTPSSSSDDVNNNNNGRIVGARELRQMLQGRSSSAVNSITDEFDMVALQEVRFQVVKSIEKIVALANLTQRPITSQRSKRSSPPPPPVAAAAAAVEEDATAFQPAATLTRGQRKQLQHLAFFRAHYALLLLAIDARVAAIDSTDSNATAAAVAAAAATRIKQLVAKSRRQSEDLFRVRALLERAQCTVRMVLSGARIPIIRFLHQPSAFECDVCFENVLATRNTFLLRAYAQVDDRARVLGVAIKHWAKQRGIHDASMGYLSSYSFVLLVVYYLQTVAFVLPNLQDPQLLTAMRKPLELYNNVNIAFCTDVAAAQAFHRASLAAAGRSASTASIATLFVGFFTFYATHFDFSRRVVMVRTPFDAGCDKRSVWGVQRTRTWRMSLQDPLETTRDLGCVLQFKCQAQILHEFKRAATLLHDGKSFADVVAPAAAVVSANAAAAAAAAAAVATATATATVRPQKALHGKSKTTKAVTQQPRNERPAPNQARAAAVATNGNVRDAPNNATHSNKRTSDRKGPRGNAAARKPATIGPRTGNAATPAAAVAAVARETMHVGSDSVA